MTIAQKPFEDTYLSIIAKSIKINESIVQENSNNYMVYIVSFYNALFIA